MDWRSSCRSRTVGRTLNVQWEQCATDTSVGRRREEELNKPNLSVAGVGSRHIVDYWRDGDRSEQMAPRLQ